MRSIRLLLLLFTFGFAPSTIGAEAGLADRLVGVWREYHPSSNVVQFYKDGTTKLYLKKGEIRDLRSLDGKWVITDTGMLAITYAVGDKSLTLEARVTFENEEMILIEKNGDQTKHRKHVGPIPQVYVW